MAAHRRRPARSPRRSGEAVSRPKVGVLHPGTQHSWQTALALQEGGALGWYATSIFYDPDKWPYRIERHLPQTLAEKANRTFRRRYEPALDPRLVRRLGPWGWIAAGTAALIQGRAASWTVRQGNRDFGQRVVRLLEREPVDIVWAYDTAALDVFRWAKRRGIYCVLDRTIAHSATANAAMTAEYVRHPEFFLVPFTPKSKRDLDEEQEELELADIVLTGSQFCAGTLIENGSPATKVKVLPYGFDERLFSAARPLRPSPHSKPINFLFAGGVGARKGVPYLLKAFNEIPSDRATLTLAGQLAMPRAKLEKFRTKVSYVSHLDRPHLTEYFNRADCFIFPSLLEGSALVLREIYGAGLGAIHTRSAGEGVGDGRNGLVFEAPSVAGIVEAVERTLADRDCLTRWQTESWAMRSRCTWRVYRAGVRGILDAVATGDMAQPFLSVERSQVRGSWPEPMSRPVARAPYPAPPHSLLPRFTGTARIRGAPT